MTFYEFFILLDDRQRTCRNRLPFKGEIMSRNFGTHGGRPALGGMSDRPSASIGSYAPSNSILLPPISPPLERSEFKQALLDVLCVCFATLFLTVTGLGVAFSLFIFWFVQI